MFLPVSRGWVRLEGKFDFHSVLELEDILYSTWVIDLYQILDFILYSSLKKFLWNKSEDEKCSPSLLNPLKKWMKYYHNPCLLVRLPVCRPRDK